MPITEGRTETKSRGAQGRKPSNSERGDGARDPDFWPEGAGPAETSLLGEENWEQVMCEVFE